MGHAHRQPLWRRLLYRLNPAVPRGWLAPLAGTAWSAVGVVLLVRAGIWLGSGAAGPVLVAAGIGLLFAGLQLPLVFVPLARKNLRRLAERPGRTCVFSLFAWRSWGIALVMAVGGVLLRHSPTPRLVLAAPYLGVGLCLLGGGAVYLRGALRERSRGG